MAVQEGAGDAATATIKAKAPKASMPPTVAKTNAAIEDELRRLAGLHADCSCYPFMFPASLTDGVVDDVYTDLRARLGDGGKRLVVVVDSGGGSIDAAYNLAHLFRRYGSEELIFIVPRWAKSAATLLVCGGDKILMSPVAELGPLDPQITAFNPLEHRLESFSPLHVDATLDLIRKEYATGSQKLAEALMQRLQFPLTLGSYKKMLDIGDVYVQRLLGSRMLKGQDESAKKVGERLAREYSDHGFVINLEEAKRLGLVAEELTGDELEIVWTIHRLDLHRRDLARRQKEKENAEKLKRLPPGLLEQLQSAPGDQPGNGVVE
jgi:ClpP class serine protease